MRQALSAFLSHHCTSCLKESEFILAVTSDMLIFRMYEFYMRSLMVPTFLAAQSICKGMNRHNLIQGLFNLSVYENVRNFVKSTTSISTNTENKNNIDMLLSFKVDISVVFCSCVIYTHQRSCRYQTFLHLYLSTRG